MANKMLLRSSIEAATWPAVLTDKAAKVMAVQQQLGESQWWPPARMRAAQFEQLRPLVEFAMGHVPFYAERLQAAGLRPGVPLTEAMWDAVPVSTRRAVRDAGEALHPPGYPLAHGNYGLVTTGGSTGVPVRVRKSELAQLMWECSHIRERLWAAEGTDGTLVRFWQSNPNYFTPLGYEAVLSAEGLVLDADGRACAPGEVGRVVVTPLHNYATPLLRYEVGDEAELGGPCSCGRGLGVLKRIVGRAHDYLHLPSGGRRRANLNVYQMAKIEAVAEYQIVQRALDRIELRLVMAEPLTAETRAAIHALAVTGFGSEFAIDITVQDSLPRTASGKLLAFVSALPAAVET